MGRWGGFWLVFAVVSMWLLLQLLFLFFLGGGAFIAGHLWHVISTEASNSTRMQQAAHGGVNEESTAIQANIPYAAMNKNKRRR